MLNAKVIVTGDEETAHDFSVYGDELAEGIERANRTVATQQAQDATRAALSVGGVAAHVAPSVSAHGDEATFGGSPWPMAMGAEFGRDQYAQFDGWTGSGESAGYFFVPTIQRSEELRLHEYEQALDSASRRAF